MPPASYNPAKFIEDILLLSFGVFLFFYGLKETYLTFFRPISLASDPSRINSAVAIFLPIAFLALLHIVLGVVYRILKGGLDIVESSSEIASSFVTRYWTIPAILGAGALASTIISVILSPTLALPPGSKPTTFLLPAALLLSAGLGCASGIYFTLQFESSRKQAKSLQSISLIMAFGGGVGFALSLSGTIFSHLPLLLIGSFIAALFLHHRFIIYLFGGEEEKKQ